MQYTFEKKLNIQIPQIPTNAMEVAAGLIETSPQQARQLAISTALEGDRWLWTYLQKGKAHSKEQTLSSMVF